MRQYIKKKELKKLNSKVVKCSGCLTKIRVYHSDFFVDEVEKNISEKGFVIYCQECGWKIIEKGEC